MNESLRWAFGLLYVEPIHVGRLRDSDEYEIARTDSRLYTRISESVARDYVRGILPAVLTWVPFNQAWDDFQKPRVKKIVRNLPDWF